MSILAVINFILVVFILGYAISFIFLQKSVSNSIFRLGISFGLGSLIIITELFLYSLLSIPIIPITIATPFLLLFLFKAKNVFEWFKQDREFFVLPSNHFEKMLIFLIGLIVMFAGIEAVLRVPMGWDGIATWLLQAKAFYYIGGLKMSLYDFTRFDSPPGIGLFLSSFYTMVGGVKDRDALLIFSAFYLATLFVLYGTLREFTSRRCSLVFVFLFATLQPVIRQAGRFEAGYADLPLSYFFLLATSLLMLYQKKRQPALLALGSLFAGFSCFIKNEGAMFFLIYSLLALSMVFSIKKGHMNYLLTGLVAFASWNLYKMFNPFFPSYLATGHLNLNRIVPVLISMCTEFFRIYRWNFFWVTLFFVLVVAWKKIISLISFQIAFLQLVGYFFIFIFTPLDPIDQIWGSFDRLLLHIAPLLFLSLVIISYDILSQSSILHEKEIKLPRGLYSRSPRMGKKL